jgi:hypothetical protein
MPWSMIALATGNVKAGTALYAIGLDLSAFPYPLWFPFSFRYSLGVTPVCFLNM